MRPYQHNAHEGILNEFKTHRSTLLHMATGLGKTASGNHMKYFIQNQADFLGFEFRRSLRVPAESSWLLGYEQGYRQALLMQIRTMKRSAEMNNCWPMVREALKRGVKSVNKKTK